MYRVEVDGIYVGDQKNSITSHDPCLSVTWQDEETESNISERDLCDVAACPLTVTQDIVLLHQLSLALATRTIHQVETSQGAPGARRNCIIFELTENSLPSSCHSFTA
jgi:hypothetical protein